MPEAPPKPKRTEVARLLELRQLRLELSRQDDILKREEAALTKSIGAWFKATVKKVLDRLQGVKLHGVLVRHKLANGSVAWKNEFIRVAGAVEADRVANNTPQVERLEIQPVKK